MPDRAFLRFFLSPGKTKKIPATKYDGNLILFSVYQTIMKDTHQSALPGLGCESSYFPYPPP